MTNIVTPAKSVVENNKNALLYSDVYDFSSRGT
jgi:hypothetical protein